MNRSLFTRIVRDLSANCPYFQEGCDAVGKAGISALVKCTSAIRQLAYAAVPDSLDEYLQIGEKTSRDCLMHFCNGVIELYGEMATTDKESSAAGTDNRPPMLEESDFESWKIRIERYIRGKPLGKLIWKSIKNGPSPHPMITVTTGEGEQQTQVTREKTDEEFTEAENNKERADIQATNILSQGLPRHIFNTLNQTETAKEIWENVELLMQGSGLTEQQKKETLFDQYERFRANGNESIHDYFVRFHKLINDMKITKMEIPVHQRNTKFVNNLPSYWGKYVTIVKNSKDISTVSYVDLYTHLKSYEQHAMKTLSKMNQTSGNADPLAYIITTESVQRRASGNKGKHAATGSQGKVDSRWFKDKALLMEAKEKGVILDAEAEAFLADVECTTPYAEPLAITTTTAFEVSHEVTYDSDVDEAPHAATTFMANLMQTGPSTRQGTNNDTNFHSEVQTYDNHFFDNMHLQDLHKSALGHRNLLYLKSAQMCRLTLYLGDVIVDPVHTPLMVFDSEETLVQAEVSRTKIWTKVKIIDKKSLEIENKNLLIQNECLLAESVSKDICSVVLTSNIVVPMSVEPRSNCVEEHSRNLELEAEILKVKQLLVEKEKRCSFIETKYQELELKFQKYKECFENPQVCNNSSSPELNVFFEINKLKDQLQGKDELLRKLKAQIGNMNEVSANLNLSTLEFQALETENTQLKEELTAVRIKNDSLRDENLSIKKRYQDLYQSKAESNSNVSSRAAVPEKPKVLAPGLYAMTPKYIPPQKRNNREANTPLPKEREVASTKPHHMIAPGSSRYSSNDMVHNHYLEEAKKQTHEIGRNSKTSVIPSARSQSTANGSKPKPRINNQKSRNWPASKTSYVTTKTVPIAEHSRNSRNFSDSKHFVCSTCQKCVFNANHDHCVTKFLNEVNSRAKVPSNKTTNRNKPVEQISVAKKPERQIPKGHRFSIKKTSVVHEKTMTPRSCLRWKPTGKIFKTVGLRWVPTGKIFTSSTTKVDSEPTNGSDEDITNQYEYKETLDVSAGTPNLSAGLRPNSMALGHNDAGPEINNLHVRETITITSTQNTDGIVQVEEKPVRIIPGSLWVLFNYQDLVRNQDIHEGGDDLSCSTLEYMNPFVEDWVLGIHQDLSQERENLSKLMHNQVHAVKDLYKFDEEALDLVLEEKARESRGHEEWLEKCRQQEEEDAEHERHLLGFHGTI
ncbi:hypothetical protein Tco_0032391 [Tanacetum coccineum]